MWQFGNANTTLYCSHISCYQALILTVFKVGTVYLTTIYGNRIFILITLPIRLLWSGWWKYSIYDIVPIWWTLWDLRLYFAISLVLLFGNRWLIQYRKYWITKSERNFSFPLQTSEDSLFRTVIVLRGSYSRKPVTVTVWFQGT